jgi:hypothetical protein
VVVFLLLGVVWAAVLVPPWLQSRREARPIASMMSFRSQLWSLERATPYYGDMYGVYGDDADEDVADVTGEPADVHALEPPRRSGGAPARATASLVSGVPAAPAAAVVRRRALAYRRRRQVLSVLMLATASGAAPAVLFAGPWIVAEAVVATLLVAYLGLLVRRGRREAERAQKVRYLSPIRAPRPSVVVIGSGAAR